MAETEPESESATGTEPARRAASGPATARGTTASATGGPFAPRVYLETLPVWKKIAIGAAVVMLVAAAATAFAEDPATGPAAAPSTLRATNETGEGGTDVPWSQALFKFGFSFFIGFAIGYATRAFLKLLLVIVGALAVCLFLLSYAGFVVVDWTAIDASFTQFGEAFTGQFDKFRTFITGSLPNAGLAGLGLFTGFKKNQ